MIAAPRPTAKRRLPASPVAVGVDQAWDDATGLLPSPVDQTRQIHGAAGPSDLAGALPLAPAVGPSDFTGAGASERPMAGPELAGALPGASERPMAPTLEAGPSEALASMPMEAAAAAAPQAQADPADPFGGTGVWLANSQQWVPQGHPLAAQAGAAPTATAATPAGPMTPPTAAAPAAAATPAAAGATSPDPFGGTGVWLAGSQQWVPQGHPLASQAGAAGPGGPGPGGAATPATVQQTFQTQLQKLLGGPTPEESAASVGTSAQANAFRHGQQRSFERDSQQLAEENAVGGGHAKAGGLSNALRGLRQNQGEAEAQHLSGLAGEAASGRRAELMQAMGMAQAMGDNNATRALQLQIAQIDATERRRSTDVTRELGISDTDLRRMLGLGDLELRRSGQEQSASQFGSSMGQENEQFGLNYGLRVEELRQRAAQQAWENMMFS